MNLLRWRLTIAVLLVVGALAATVIGPYWRVAPRVNTASIRAVRPGMTSTEVVATLGPPLQVRAWGEEGVILDYAVPHLLAPWSSRLWVYLRGDRVDTVLGEREPLLAFKRGVYVSRADGLEWASDEFETTFQRWGKPVASRH